jgi:hypothetical protein
VRFAKANYQTKYRIYKTSFISELMLRSLIVCLCKTHNLEEISIINFFLFAHLSFDERLFLVQLGILGVLAETGLKHPKYPIELRKAFHRKIDEQKEKS